MTANTRIRTIAPGIEAEALAPETIIQWNAAAGTGSITYASAWHYREANTTNYFGLPEPDGALREDMAGALARAYEVPDPVNGGTKIVSGVDVMLFLKAHFNGLHNEQRGGA